MSNDFRSEVRVYYELGWEKDRLKTGKGHAQAIEGDIEKTRTVQILSRYLPKPPATIVDVGGAAGAYSFWLAGLGHKVHLVDLTPLHVEQANEKQEKTDSPKLASCNVGDACNLNFSDNFADVVLCMGPLYHLPNLEDRRHCLSEAHRVLKPGGMLFAVGISRFVSLLEFLKAGLFNDAEITKLIQHDLVSGCHINPTKNPKFFTTAFFHKPEDFRREIEEAQLVNVNIMAIEGPILLTKDLDSHWANPDAKSKLLAFAEQVESEPSVMGMSNHLAAVGNKAV